jgi:hypothetical protein
MHVLMLFGVRLFATVFDLTTLQPDFTTVQLVFTDKQTNCKREVKKLSIEVNRIVG